jgi:hypothetical protein
MNNEGNYKAKKTSYIPHNGVFVMRTQGPFFHSLLFWSHQNKHVLKNCADQTVKVPILKIINKSSIAS